MRQLVLLALSLVGLFDSIFLWWMYVSPSRPMVCMGTGCDVVRASSYAHLWGLPLPVFGVAMYGALALVIFSEPLASGAWARKASYGIAAISGGGFLASLFLSGIEAFVLHHWCEWCVMSALTVTAIFALALLELFRPSARQQGSAVAASLRRYVTVVVIAILVGVPAFVFLSRAEAIAPSPSASAEALQEHLIRHGSHVFGNPNSPVTVVEFGDFQCPYCGTAEKTVRKIREDYQSRVRFVFRQFPLSNVHAYAEKAAEASECAADQGKFWEAFEKFYDNQVDLSVPALERYSGELGLDRPRFNECLSSGAMAARIAEDMADGRAVGVTRTPTFFIDDQKIEGGLEYEKFSQLLDRELASRGVTVPPGESGGKPQTEASRGNAFPAGSTSSATAPPAATAGETNPSQFSGLLGGNSGRDIFTPRDSSLAGCSESAANERQPALIDTSQARRLFQDRSHKALFVDVRPATDYQKARIQGALNMPLDDMNKLWSQLPRDRSIVLYESGLSANPDDICASGRTAGRFLLTHGFSPDFVKVYHDGLKAWEKAGLPVERGHPSGS